MPTTFTNVHFGDGIQESKEHNNLADDVEGHRTLIELLMDRVQLFDDRVIKLERKADASKKIDGSKKVDAPKEMDVPNKIDGPKKIDVPKKVDAPKKAVAEPEERRGGMYVSER